MARKVVTKTRKSTSKKTKEIKKLKQLEKYRKDFVGNVSHELKTLNIQAAIFSHFYHLSNLK